MSLFAADVRQPDGSVEWRTHFEAKDEVGHVAFRLTHMNHVSGVQDRDEQIVLVQDDVTHDRVVITVANDFMMRKHLTVIRLLDTNETLTVSYPTPWKSLTRQGALDESREHPEKMADPIARLTMNMNGVEETLSDAEWKSPVGASKKSALWRAASSQFLDVLYRLRAIGTQPELLPTLCSGLLAVVLYDAPCPAGPDIVTAKPDCSFDASFRYACSKASLDRIAKDPERKSVGGTY